MIERHSRVVQALAVLVILVTALIGTLVIRYGGPVQLALIPTQTALPPSPTQTSRPAGQPPIVDSPSATSTATAIPTSTPSPQPSRSHAVSEGETLIMLALVYNVSMESIAELNDMSIETPIQAGQSLQIPWPTATPPLVPIVLEIGGEPVIADPTTCRRYEIQEGDAISVIAAQNNINLQLLLRVNRLTEQSILQPGDTICIPEIVYGGVLPPTPGPSPTPAPTTFPAGPRLLYPRDGAVYELTDEPITLQWVAVKDLELDEWYMVEVTDVSTGGRPLRGFTRQNAFRIPSHWRPKQETYHEFRWRVSLVRATGQRQDGGLIYGFGGFNSDFRSFSWFGAIPTPTPTPTPLPSLTSEP